MSQNGVKGMLNSGKSWDEILKYYYNGIEIGFVPV
jgi:peptidoglycan hydrolase-like amidase